MHSLRQQRPEPLPVFLPVSGTFLLMITLILLPDGAVFGIVLQPVTESLTGLPVQRLISETDSQRHQSSQVVILQLNTSNGRKVRMRGGEKTDKD